MPAGPLPAHLPAPLLLQLLALQQEARGQLPPLTLHLLLRLRQRALRINPTKSLPDVDADAYADMQVHACMQAWPFVTVRCTSNSYANNFSVQHLKTQLDM
jgi:hypothetical protein